MEGLDPVLGPLVKATAGFGASSVKQGIGLQEKEDELEDLMEWFNNEFSKDPDEQKKANWVINKARRLFLPSCVTRFPLRHSMGGKINDIGERLKTVKENLNSVAAVPKHTERHRLSSGVDESKIVGRDKDKGKLKGMLGCPDDMPDTKRYQEMTTATTASTSTSTAVEYVFITGPPGYGKRELARSVQNDKKVKKHFKGNIFWVSVGGLIGKGIDDNKKLATDIIKAVEGRETPKYHEWDPLRSYLKNCIKSKENILLVLDDISDVDCETWDTELKPCLDAAAPGSRILVTTQLTNLSTKMGVSSKHTLPLNRLLENDAWLLLCETALRGLSGEQIAELETIAKELVRECKGVPFVIKQLGFALRTNVTPQAWKAILKSGIWNLKSSTGENLLSPLLLTTYDNFFPALQRCFKLCACLPIDCKINSHELITLWMALGFLGEMQDGEMEEKGNRCFDMLRTHSFLYPIGNDDENEKEDHYKMYPHVCALAQSLAGNESCYYSKIGTSSYRGADTLHATIILRDDDTGNVPGPLSQAIKLRMLKLIVVKLPEFKVPSYVFRKFPYLRALDMSCTRLTELPPEVSKLKLLKYLNLSGSRFQKISDTVCDLKNLQTLVLNDCAEVTELPEKIGQLTNLRHLELKDTPELKKFPQGFGKLTNLRTLSKFVVAAHGSRKGAKIGELKEVNLLQGHLEIKGLHRVKSGSDAIKAALADKTDLQSLSLDFEHNLSQKPESVKIMEDVLETLKPNQAVEIVQLCNYPETARLPSWWVPINQE